MAPTDDELDESVPQEIRQRISTMTNDEAARRHEELRTRIVAVKPPYSDITTEAELQEYHLLKKRLQD